MNKHRVSRMGAWLALCRCGVRPQGVRTVYAVLSCALALTSGPAMPDVGPQDVALVRQSVRPAPWNSGDGAAEQDKIAKAAQHWLHALDAVPGAWQPVQALTWFGRPLWLRAFVLPQDVGEAAQRLTQANPALDRVLTGPDTLLLSGSQGDLHLVVQLQRSPQGVSGFASALDVSSSMRNAASPASDAALAWLAQDTQVHAAQWRLADGVQVSQFIHAVPQAPDALRARLRIVLARQGWVETAAVTGQGDAQWQRRGDRLHLMPDRSGRGSLLYQRLIVGQTP